jgi:hypothetical protein
LENGRKIAWGRNSADKRGKKDNSRCKYIIIPRICEKKLL